MEDNVGNKLKVVIFEFFWLDSNNSNIKKITIGKCFLKEIVL